MWRRSKNLLECSVMRVKPQCMMSRIHDHTATSRLVSSSTRSLCPSRGSRWFSLLSNNSHSLSSVQHRWRDNGMASCRRWFTSSPPSSSNGDGAVDGRLHILFTCSKCETRVAKSLSKQAYYQGVVLCRCPGCQNLHLLADNLNYFGSGKRNIEDIMRQKGQDVKRVDDSTWEIEPETIAGKKI